MILDGKKLAEKIKAEIRREIKKTGVQPGLASILVGNNPASALYISIKEREANKIGINFKKYHFKNFQFLRQRQILGKTGTISPPKADPALRDNFQLRIINLIKKLNHDQRIHGILVQLPLPKGFDTDKIIRAIDPQKDIDGFHPENLKLLKTGKPRFVPPTIAGILALVMKAIKHESKKTRSAIILANSKIFAEPLKSLLEKRGVKTAAVTSRQSRVTSKERGNIREADIIIVAKGKPKFITADMVKKGAIVIDVGTNRVNGKLAGDIDFAAVSKKAAWVTSVPGGVGPMTVAMLLQNVWRAARRSLRHRESPTKRRGRGDPS